MLSVVVCTRNKLPYLQATLPVLLREASRHAEVREVVVVDDGSDDGTAELLRAHAAGGTAMEVVTRRPEPCGLAASRNEGAAVARGTHLLFLDDDVLVTPAALPTFLAGVHADRAAVHVGRLRNVALDRVGAVLAARGEVAPARLEGWCSPVPMYAAMGALCGHRDAAPCPAAWWAIVTGGNLCVPAPALHEVGGFDEEFDGWGPEDADLCYRLFLRGTAARYHPRATLFHLDHPRSTERVTAALMRNAARFFRKHGKPDDLLDYLRFFNGELTLDAFNRRVAERHAMALPALVAVGDFRLDMAYVTRRDQLVARGRA